MPTKGLLYMISLERVERERERETDSSVLLESEEDDPILTWIFLPQTLNPRRVSFF